MPLSDIVNIVISSDSPGVSRAGFGVPIVLSGTADWEERTRTYTSLAGVGADFDTTDPEYLAAEAIFSQSPKVRSLVIGRIAGPTMVTVVSIKSVENSTAYSLRVGGQLVSITSGSSATNDDIVNALVTAINLLTLTTTAAATGTTLSKVVTLTGDSAGAWDPIEVLDRSLLAQIETTADTGGDGVSGDLDAILLENDAWYAVVSPYRSAAIVDKIGDWIEANARLFCFASADSAIATHVLSGATDVFAARQTEGHARTFGLFHHDPMQFADAAWLGKCLPLDPGSETWAYKTLSGVDAVSMTGTEIANVLAKSGNTYTLIAGVNVTRNGIVFANEFVDVIRFRDWLVARMSEGIFGKLAASSKIPFDDDGIAVVESVIRQWLTEGVRVKGLAADPAPVVEVPKAADVPAEDRAARLLSGVTFSARLAGAIHTADINGSVTP